MYTKHYVLWLMMILGNDFLKSPLEYFHQCYLYICLHFTLICLHICYPYYLEPEVTTLWVSVCMGILTQCETWNSSIVFSNLFHLKTPDIILPNRVFYIGSVMKKEETENTILKVISSYGLVLISNLFLFFHFIINDDEQSHIGGT